MTRHREAAPEGAEEVHGEMKTKTRQREAAPEEAEEAHGKKEQL